MARKNTRTLTDGEKMEAEVLAEEMFLRRVAEVVIGKALQKQYAIGSDASQRILKKVIANIQECVQRQAPHRRAQAIASLDRLYERCLDAGRFGTALGVQKVLAKIEGHEKPIRVVHTEAASTGDEEFEGKTFEELEYYAAHGKWEDGTSPAPEAPKPDPTFPLQLKH